MAVNPIYSQQAPAQPAPQQGILNDLHIVPLLFQPPPGNPNITLFNHVPMTIRTKVWNNEYVDFAELLKRTAVVIDQPKVLKERNGQLVWKAASSSRKVYNYIVWRSVFNVFSGINLLRYPNLGTQLLQYAYYIQEAASTTQWLYVYDVSFRQKLGETGHTNWEILDMPLYNSTISRAPTSGRNQLALQSVVFNCKPCIKYNQGNCQGGCGYPHRCSKCSKNGHLANQYRSRSGGTRSKSQQ